MSGGLSLRLEVVAQAADRLLFRLHLRNEAAVRLLVPYPEIHGLRFVNKATLAQSEWYTSLFVSAAWGGFTLEPCEERSVEYRARPCDVEAPAEDDGSDYYRWCIA